MIQEVYEDLLKRSNQNNIAIQNIQDTIENEVSEMRNLTYQMLGENGGMSHFKILILSFLMDKYIIIIIYLPI